MLRIFRTESFSPFRISNVYTTRNHFQLSRRRIRFVGIGERKEGEKRVARAGVLNSYENPNSICNNPDWVFTRSLRSVYKNAIFGRMRSLKDRRGFTRKISGKYWKISRFFDLTPALRMRIDFEGSILI